MSMHDMYAAFELIRNNASFVDFAGPQPDDRVTRAQAALGIDFPPTYEEFVAMLGCGGLGSAEFYGVVADDFERSSAPDAIWLTLKHRKDCSIPDDFIVVGSTGDGGFYAIDTAKKNADGEGPVVEWWPGFPDADDSPRVVAPDFGAFFLDEITQAIARAKCRSRDAE
ncbi:MAG: SMI1/KNR4 family protein [Pirellulales bacterium]